MKPENPNDTISDEFIDNGMDVFRSVSATDCTGLIPAGIPSEEELESYYEMFDYGASVPDVEDDQSLAP